MSATEVAETYFTTEDDTIRSFLLGPQLAASPYSGDTVHSPSAIRGLRIVPRNPSVGFTNALRTTNASPTMGFLVEYWVQDSIWPDDASKHSHEVMVGRFPGLRGWRVVDTYYPADL